MSSRITVGVHMSVRAVVLLTVVVLWSVVAACSDGVSPPLSPPPPPPPPASLLLRDIVIPNLPSPYYHFEYDPTARMTFVSFASDFTRYDVTWDGARISELRNNILVNHDRLVYVYDDSGRVALIQEVDDNGVTFTHVVLTYEGAKLIGLERDRRVTGGFIIDKTMTFSYYPDGNLRQRTVHRPAIAGVQGEATYSDLFEQYDTGINVDGFSLLHDEFFDHLVLLPGVQLQQSNPRRVTRTGDAEHYVLEDTYTYDASNRPISRTGELTYLTGANAGRHFQTSATFSYYP